MAGHDLGEEGAELLQIGVSCCRHFVLSRVELLDRILPGADDQACASCDNDQPREAVHAKGEGSVSARTEDGHHVAKGDEAR